MTPAILDAVAEASRPPDTDVQLDAAGAALDLANALRSRERDSRLPGRCGPVRVVLARAVRRALDDAAAVVARAA